jgi:hypothetical protein
MLIRKLFSAALLLVIGPSLALAASWYTWPQIWGKDETMPENVNIVRAQRENLLTAGNVIQFGKDPSALRSAVNSSHAAGLKIVGQICNTILRKDDPDAPALVAAGVEAVKYNGQKFVDWYITACPNQPAWRNYQKEVIRGMASAEIDGFGSIYGDWLVERCFCSSCEAYFRSYLKNHYTSSQLLADFGISDVDVFDYSDYLNGRGITQTQIEDDSDKSAIPLLEDYYKLKDQLAVEYLNELTDTAKAYGKSDIIIMNGAEGCGTAKYVRLPAMEAYSYYANFDALNPIFSYKENTQAIYYQILKAMHPASAVVAGLVDESAGGIIKTTADPEKYIYSLMAEALANRALFYDQDRVGLWNGEALGWSIDPSVNLKVKTFLQNYYPAFDFDNLLSCARIGVLYSSRSLLKSDRLRPDYGESSIAGIGKALSQTGHQYDIIFNGDGELAAETISQNVLSRYELVIIPETISLTDKEKLALDSYANNGGNLLAYADIDSSFPLTPGETVHGSGKIFYETAPLPRFYNGTASGTYLGTIEAQVNRYVSGKIVSGIDKKSVISQVWKTENPKRTYLHLINHDAENKVFDLPIDLELPSNFGVDRVYLTSPDLSGDQILSHSKDGNHVSFTVPELDVWDLIIIFSTQESQESAQRSTIINSLACGPSPASTSTGFYYNLAEPSAITLRIYSITGELIRLISGSCNLPNFNRALPWDLKDVSGTAVQNGVYVYIFEARGQSGKTSRQRGKLIILK